jgi:hypothetical protein
MRGMKTSLTMANPNTLGPVRGAETDTDIDGDTITKPVVSDGGDHDKFAHYVRKNKITESAVTGAAVTAICGKKWVPTRAPDDFPVCPDCKRIYEQLKSSK